MVGKIRAIIKRPKEQYGHMTHISPALENLQKHVGGPIETYTRGDIVIICNEEGKLRHLPKNFYAGTFPFIDVFVGTVIVVGHGEEDFTDIPITFDAWKKILNGWGNY